MMNPKHVLQNQKYSCLSSNYLQLDLIEKFLEIYIFLYILTKLLRIMRIENNRIKITILLIFQYMFRIDAKSIISW